MTMFGRNGRRWGLIGTFLVAANGGSASGLRVGWVDINRIDQVVSETNEAMNTESPEWLERVKKVKTEHDVMTGHQQEFDIHQTQWTASDRQEKQKQIDQELTNYQRDLRELREDEALKIRQDQVNLHQQVKEIIKTIAIKEQFDVIVTDVWYVNPKYDLTSQVLRQLAPQAKP